MWCLGPTVVSTKDDQGLPGSGHPLLMTSVTSLVPVEPSEMKSCCFMGHIFPCTQDMLVSVASGSGGHSYSMHRKWALEVQPLPLPLMDLLGPAGSILKHLGPVFSNLSDCGYLAPPTCFMPKGAHGPRFIIKSLPMQWQESPGKPLLASLSLFFPSTHAQSPKQGVGWDREALGHGGGGDGWGSDCGHQTPVTARSQPQHPLGSAHPGDMGQEAHC